MSDVIPPPSDPQPGSANANERMWNMICHLSALSGFVGIPFGNIIGPLIVWQIKKSEFPGIEAYGKEALNFQITVTVAAIVLATVGMLICVGPLIAVAVAIAALVFTIIAGVKANNGEFYRYPLTVRLLK